MSEPVPIKATVTRYDELKPHPLGGRKAQLIRDQAISEADALERENARQEAERAQKLKPLTDAESQLPPMELTPGFSPAIERVQALLPDETRQLLDALRKVDGGLVGGIELALDGDSPAWSFYDPCLWTFGIDGGGNVFALHVYPPAMENNSRVPVVFWDHAIHTHFFQAENLKSFLGQYLQAETTADPDSASHCASVARQLGVTLTARGNDRLREDPHDTLDWPLPTAGDLGEVKLSAEHLRERELVRRLVEASSGPADVVEPLAGLDALYQKLGWTHHLNVLRHQRADWFALQKERYLARA